MVAACNAPKEVLDNLDSPELVELMLDYPLLGDLMLYDDVNMGFSVLAENSNIYKEIVSRADGAEALLKAYCDLDVTKKSAFSQEEISKYELNPDVLFDDMQYNNLSAKIENEQENIITTIFLEAALAQKDVIEDLDRAALEILVEEAEEKTAEKDASNVYSAYTDTIYSVAKDAGSLEKFGTAVQSRKAIYVKTPKGSKVEVLKRGYNASESASAYQYTQSAYPKATIVSAATTEYNCHSFAWYSQNTTTNKYWMNNPGAYMSDGSYTHVGSKPTNKKQKVCYVRYPYQNPYIHSGIVIKINGEKIRIKSKWGAGPLVKHNVKYSPYEGTPVYYK